MLHSLLKQLDFNDKEITIYLAILEKGKINPSEVAQITGINRTTVYSVAKELIRRGIVSEDLGASPRLFVPKIVFVPQENLESYLYSRAAVWNESIMQSDGIWWGFQDQTFTKHYQKWIDWYWKNSAPEKLKLQLLSNQSEIEKKFD